LSVSVATGPSRASRIVSFIGGAFGCRAVLQGERRQGLRGCARV
jgi:hypothetical protein